MVDLNRPTRWNVIDEQNPRAIVATYTKLSEARALCEALEPNADPFTGYRFICEPVRSSVAA